MYESSLIQNGVNNDFAILLKQYSGVEFQPFQLLVRGIETINHHLALYKELI